MTRFYHALPAKVTECYECGDTVLCEIVVSDPEPETGYRDEYAVCRTCKIRDPRKEPFGPTDILGNDWRDASLPPAEPEDTHVRSERCEADCELCAGLSQEYARILAALMDSLIAQKAPDSVSGYELMDAILPEIRAYAAHQVESAMKKAKEL